MKFTHYLPALRVKRCSETPSVFRRARRTSSGKESSKITKLQQKNIPSVGIYRTAVTLSIESRKLEPSVRQSHSTDQKILLTSHFDLVSVLLAASIVSLPSHPSIEQ